jgi:hypothetical protein
LSNKYRIPELPEETQTSVPVENSPSEKSKSRKKGVLAGFLAWIFSGTFLASEKNVRHLPFILFLSLLAILYISNGFYADDKIRESNRITEQLKELRSEYITTKSDLMFAGKQSEIAKAVSSLGLREPVTPPHKIKIDSSLIFSE